MAGSGNIHDGLRPRRFELGTEDDDLEAMQRDFLASSSKPAAKVVRRNQPPEIATAKQRCSQDAVDANANTSSKNCSKEDKQATASPSGTAPADVPSVDVLDFAKRMAGAIKEFEVKERETEAQSTPADNRPTVGPQIEPTSARTPASKGLPSAKPKRLSLFAQRWLAKLDQTAGSDSSIDPGRSGTATSSSATFLPKLMAPVPEHKADGPVRVPKLQPRASGFPEVPIDVSPEKVSQPAPFPSAAARSIPATVDGQSGDYWSQVRDQVSQENSERIKGMSEADILEAQSEIQSMISQETIQRLQGRKGKLSDAPRVVQESSTYGKDNAVGGSAMEHMADQSKPKAKEAKQVRFAKPMPDDNSSDDDDDGFFAPPPPPPAEWVGVSSKSDAGKGASIDVDNNETGADSEFYSAMKRRYFPSEVVEEAKLAWILGHNQAKSPMEHAVQASRQMEKAAVARALGDDGVKDVDLMDKRVAHVRFAFDGQIMTEEESDIPTNTGLHHHGDDPEKPGYTIPELLHLSRSTVPAQRTVAMATLGCILHKFNIGVWSTAQSAEVYMGLLDWQAELYFAQGISDTNKTGRAEAAITLWTWIVEMANYKSLVRVSTGGEAVAQTTAKPGPDINIIPEEAAAAKGAVVDRTFKALDSILTTAFLDTVHDTVALSLLPQQQLSMLAECIKYLASMSDIFKQRIGAHGRILVLLQNKFPYLMSK